MIWIYHNGKHDDPKLEIDHIGQDSLDNRIKNLRLVTRRENALNQKQSKKNTSGQTGVSWNKRAKMWVAYIKIDGKLIHLGYYIEKEDAIKARKEAEIKYGFHENHGKKLEEKKVENQ
jgi:hypothetical protein